MTGLDCVGYEHSVYDPAKLDIVVISVHSKLVAGLLAQGASVGQGTEAYRSGARDFCNLRTSRQDSIL